MISDKTLNKQWSLFSFVKNLRTQTLLGMLGGKLEWNYIKMSPQGATTVPCFDVGWFYNHYNVGSTFVYWDHFLFITGPTSRLLICRKAKFLFNTTVMLLYKYCYLFFMSKMKNTYYTMETSMDNKVRERPICPAHKKCTEYQKIDQTQWLMKLL